MVGGPCSILGDQTIGAVSLDECRDVFYIQYFSSTFYSQKKKEFLALEQRDGMSVTEYQAKFLTLERFGPDSFSNERETTAQFV